MLLHFVQSLLCLKYLRNWLFLKASLCLFQPTVSQAPVNQSIAAQFAAAVAARLTPANQAHIPTDGAKPQPGAGPPQVSGPVPGTSQRPSAPPNIPNGETPQQSHIPHPAAPSVVEVKQPALSGPDMTASIKTQDNVKQETSSQGEPVTVSVKSLDTHSAPSQSSKPSSRETTPEVHVVPATPVEKTVPEIPEQTAANTSEPFVKPTEPAHGVYWFRISLGCALFYSHCYKQCTV